MSDPHRVRPITSAPTAKARQRAQEAETARLADLIASDLRRQQWAKLSYTDEEERAAIKRAARRAGKEIGVKVAVRTTRDGAVMAAIDEEGGPLRDRLDEARLRNAIDDAFGDDPR
ncbi:hypothetical protein HNR23_003406 [Nocardiopsis mwathae]|uniref:Uncharacterized protein n=1 Tax=Nocardiopsis mwathae TaxID=1472723 RepID=A0A7W9YEJ1_9ACTN|nr:hypothetical protein [Nocardiopsis mwathae]MBB6170713.1 hypothetical protein [Nocardiopsis mwathae]MBB6172314.1 hypothetical protein [Nocardiopsis mwathae]MBB6173346.1 hypothetical protein [Nocardiopsis mwathae]